MSGMRSMPPARSAGALFRCRLRGPRLQPRLRAVGRPERPPRLVAGISRSDVKPAPAGVPEPESSADARGPRMSGMRSMTHRGPR